MTILTRVALLLVKLEGTPGVDAQPDVQDAILVEEAEYNIEPTFLKRNFSTGDLSPQAGVVGRKLARMSFKVELKGNGKQKSGLIADAPKLGRLLRVCGYRETALNSAASRVGAVVVDDQNEATAPVVGWVGGGAPAAGLARCALFTLQVTTGGPSGTAQVRITNNNPAGAGPAQNGVVVTSGQPVALGTTGATVTPTWAGALVADDVYRVLVTPRGIAYDPLTVGVPTATCYLYLDGLLHKMPNAQGSFSMTAEAGGYGTFEFELTGQYVKPVDEPVPAGPSFDITVPSQIELANLTFESDNSLIVGGWSYEQSNELSPRIDVNSPDGYAGVRITDRDPKGGFSPEATLVGEHDFWGAFGEGRRCLFFANAGVEPGNTVAMYGPQCQVSDMPYSDRDGIRTHDMSFGFKRHKGDDEVRFLFV